MVGELLRIFNLETMTCVGSVPPSESGAFGGGRWMQAAGTLVFSSGTGIYSYRLGDSRPVRVREVQSDRLVMIAASWPGALVYMEWLTGQAMECFLLDLSTGRRTNLGKINGWAYALDDGKKILMEIGY